MTQNGAAESLVTYFTESLHACAKNEIPFDECINILLAICSASDVRYSLPWSALIPILDDVVKQLNIGRDIHKVANLGRRNWSKSDDSTILNRFLDTMTSYLSTNTLSKSTER